jgi:glucose/arabinose dehydrogenase
MNFVKKIFSVLGIFSFLVIPGAASLAQTATSLLPTGTLIRVEGNDTVYYVENGARRPIDSWETFLMQGFQAAIRVIPPMELAYYQQGEAITKESLLTFPGQAEVAPDLAPFAAKDLQLVNQEGRMKLVFTTELWNRGRGPFELFGASQPKAIDVYETAQRIVLPDGSVRSKIVGNLFWHAAHKHFHYDDFASYVLEMVPPQELVQTPGTPILGESTVAPEIRNKSTFCLYETEPIPLPAEGAKSPNKTYTTCGRFRQGISVGWADKYDYTLPDQNFDVTDLPPGTYRLVFELDPLQHFMEGSRTNNSSVALIDLNAAAGTMRVLASGAPFFTPENNYPNGMLIRSESNPTVYIVQNNKKQLLQTSPSGSGIILPQGVFDAIPSLSLIKSTSSPTVYILNDAGFRRGIVSMEIFNSYGLKLQDVAEISESDLVNYPETDLVKRQGDSTVYSISTRRSVASVVNPASVHTINQTDFETYMVDVAAHGLFVPWDVATLPDGDMLVPERSGYLRRIGKNPAVLTVPSVLSSGEGGLMGLALHPTFAENNFIYLYYTASENGQKNRVARFRLDGNQLTEQTIIIDNIPSAIYHDGGRIAFGPDGMLYITTGDANSAALAQDLASLAGKTLRLTPDGDIPADNPYASAVWSYGHRNSQGIAWDNLGRMWQTEHGRSGALSGFDELNHVEKGKNYGWPIIQGNETRAGMVTPVLNSGANETWAPAGTAFINGSLYFGGLLGSSLYQVRFDAFGNIKDLKTHFKGKFGRLRAVVAAPDGSLYISTSNRDGRGTPNTDDDKILRIYPGFLQSSQ